VAFVERIKAGIFTRRRRRPLLPVFETAPALTTGNEEEPKEALPEVATTSSAEFDRAVPHGLQVASSWAWRALLLAALIYGLYWLVTYFSEVFVPLAVAALLAALLYPVAHRLRSWGLPRGLAALISVLGGLVLIFGSLTLIGTQIANQASDLSGNVVTGFTKLVSYLKNSSLPIDQKWFRLDQWGTKIQEWLVSSESTITSYAAEISAQVGHFLAGFAITMFALFYFLHDGRGIWTFLLKFFPRASRSRVDAAALKGWVSLSHYVRATILVALSDAVGVLIVALILGVPLAPALAALVFLGAFVPLVGAFVSGFVAVVVALVAVGWVQALIMLGGIVLVMEIEGHVLQPFLLGRAVKLHPLAVLLGIAAGIIVGGIVGALMSIPLMAFTKSFIQDLSRMHDDVLPTGELRLREGPTAS
jgi:predicted PurR-regulated permease PerM